MTEGRLGQGYMDTESWAVLELGQRDLGDPRRTKHLVHLTSTLANNPACLLPEACKSPQHPPDLKTAGVWTARLGGFLVRKRDGNPGVKVLWTGYRRRQEMVVMWDLLRSND